MVRKDAIAECQLEAMVTAATPIHCSHGDRPQYGMLHLKGADRLLQITSFMCVCKCVCGKRRLESFAVGVFVNPALTPINSVYYWLYYV